MIEIKLAPKNGACFAEGIYEAGKIIVKKGGRINLDFASHIRGGRIAKGYRTNAEYVDKNGNILKDCEFKSPSTAAQFVTGRSTNGYEAWKVAPKQNLGDYLKEKGLR